MMRQQKLREVKIFMTVKEFIAALHRCIREEFIAVSEVKENTIRVRFVNGQLITVTFSEQNEMVEENNTGINL